MRIFEVFFMSITAFTIVNLVFIKNLKLSIILPAISTVFTVMSIILEGYRLIMIPAYFLSFILLILGVFKTYKPNLKINRIQKGAIITLITLVYVVITVSAILFPVINLPKPTGTYPVGTTFMVFTDYSRKDELANPDEYRNLPVQIWYPSSETQGKKRTYWLPSSKMSKIFANCKKVPDILGQLSLVKTNSFLNADLSSKEEKYPVILFSGGSAMFNGQNAIQMEELASHGYIVCAVGHPHDDFACFYPDSSIIQYKPDHLSALSDDVDKALVLAKNEFGGNENHPDFKKFVVRNCKMNNDNIKIWSEDMSFVANKLIELNNGVTENIFNGKLDASNIAIFGHSFGGAAAGETCLHDKRFKAFINLDGTPFGTACDNVIQQPFMIITVGKDQKQIVKDAYSDKQKNFTTVYIQGAKHMNFSDFNNILPTLGKVFGILGNIEADRQKEILNDYILSFFNKHLKGIPDPLLDGDFSKYSEVTVEKE